MLQRCIVTIFLMTFALGSTAGGAWAAGGAQCVRAQCEGPGQACVTTLYVTYEACMAAGNLKCNGASAAEKFKCLRDELGSCAKARNSQEAACLGDVKSCYASCAPMEGDRADYWCVGSVDNASKAIFCEAKPSDPANVDVCEKQMSSGGILTSLTCESL